MVRFRVLFITFFLFYFYLFLYFLRNLRCARHTATSDSGLFFDNFCTNFVVFGSFAESAGPSPQCHLRFVRNLRWHCGEDPADSANDQKNDKKLYKLCQKKDPESVNKTVSKSVPKSGPKTVANSSYPPGRKWFIYGISHNSAGAMVLRGKIDSAGPTLKQAKMGSLWDPIFH